MASAWSQLEQMLTCAICLDKFKNPRLLPCQHSFCGDACMEGLVDYARRQIKCPECRAEHRIPYQGVASLPTNVTLTRFLELHSRITGEEPEPVPTFMEKCSVCGEKVEGVQRCWHCEKKVCLECKEAHNDLLRREIGRLNSQAKRYLGKLRDFRELLDRSSERLASGQQSVRREIEGSCRRLEEDLQAKRNRLLDELDSFAEAEQKTIDKLRVAIVEELETLEANGRLADEKVSNKFQWTDQELSEMKEIYVRTMEFARLFEPEVGDFTRKMRFTLVPDFESARRRVCELGELKFGEPASTLMASAFQYCNATGSVAVELCSAASAQAAAQAAQAAGSSGYGLAHSNSNSNLAGQSILLELPSAGVQNALMRSQSDHRLASQFQQRLKQQEAGKGAAARYGPRDHETDALRSRYAPPRAGPATNELTRDFPRPGDADAPDFGPSIQFKSTFMRRKEKERQQLGAGFGHDDDDDLASEASFGGRNVRFCEPARQPVPKLFDTKEVEHAPLSGVPKLEGAPHTLSRLHQMGAKAVVDKRLADEEGQRDRDLLESARRAVSRASQRGEAARKPSVDEIEKQKSTNKQREQRPAEEAPARTSQSTPSVAAPAAGRQSSGTALSSDGSNGLLARTDAVRIESSPSRSATESRPASTAPEAAAPAQMPVTATPAAINHAARRNLYGEAVNERSRWQLSSALQDQSRRRAGVSAQVDVEPPRPDTPPSSRNEHAGRCFRSSEQVSVEQDAAEHLNGGIPRGCKWNLLAQQSSDSGALPASSNGAAAGPVGGGRQDSSDGLVGSAPSSVRAAAQGASRLLYERRTANGGGTPVSSDEEPDRERPKSQSGERRPKSDSDEDEGVPDEDKDEAEVEAEVDTAGRNAGNRRSRELLPNAVSKLLDRSAQIRRDSKEQRSRGDSPQRPAARSTVQPSRDYSTPAQSSFYSSRPSAEYSNSSGGSAAVSPSARQRLNYQRSIVDEEAGKSASPSSYTNSAASRRRSSIDEEASSKRASERALAPDFSRPTSYRRDSSGDNAAPVYQSRFLARSRTSHALSTAHRSQEPEQPERAEPPARSYLSSRDKFMQSAGSSLASPASSANLYSRSGASAAQTSLAGSSLGQYRHHPSSQAYYSDNSPFIEFDDEDEEYSAYFPAGKLLRQQQLLQRSRQQSLGRYGQAGQK